MPCHVCCVGNHGDSYPHKDEDEKKTKRARSLLKKIKSKDLLREICCCYLQVPSIASVDVYFLHMKYDVDAL